MAVETSRNVGAQKPDLDRNIERVSQGAHDAVDRATAAASQMADRLGEHAERLSDKGEELMSLKEDWVEGAREYVRDNPFAALGFALAAGFILSKITGR